MMPARWLGRFLGFHNEVADVRDRQEGESDREGLGGQDNRESHKTPKSTTAVVCDWACNAWQSPPGIQTLQPGHEPAAALS